VDYTGVVTFNGTPGDPLLAEGESMQTGDILACAVDLPSRRAKRA